MERLQYDRNEFAAEVIASKYRRVPRAFVRSFGCQQNVNEGERIQGVLLDIGFELVPGPENADLILFNTCAVREHAEQRAFGNLGALKKFKKENPRLLIGVCGCMAEEKSTVDKIRGSYPYVDLVLGTNIADELPEVLMERMTTRKKALKLPERRETIVENIPVHRGSDFRAFLPITFGCDNFCSYCIVPHVRGRERSRESKDIAREFAGLVQAGYKEITLLGQNVNSYGKGLEEKTDFSDLLNLLCQTEGDYKIRFMTSHPKDATRKMIDTMVSNKQICKHLHLPVQSGSSDILAKMNRNYTSDDYLALIDYAKSVCPEMTFSSDVMVGFPGETPDDFEQTMRLVDRVGYIQLFTFIFSKRIGTKAADLPDDTPHKVKADRIGQLLQLQEEKVEQIAANWIGKTFTGLVEGEGREEGMMVARLDNNMLVEFSYTDEADIAGEYLPFEVEKLQGSILKGKLVK